MATEILVNDGGAPARILPYIAGAALTAGQAVTADGTADGQVKLTTAANMMPLGYALTDTAVGDVASIITGKGVILNVQCKPLVAGIPQMVSGVAGELTQATAAGAAAGTNACAFPLKLLGEGAEAIGVAGLWRVQTI